MGDGHLRYKIKDWLELSVFTENIGKMLNDGLMFDKAFDIASRHLGSSVNRRLAADLKEVFLGEGDSRQEIEAAYKQHDRVTTRGPLTTLHYGKLRAFFILKGGRLVRLSMRASM